MISDKTVFWIGVACYTMVPLLSVLGSVSGHLTWQTACLALAAGLSGLKGKFSTSAKESGVTPQ